MACFIKEYQTNKSREELINIINGFFQKEGFQKCLFQNEEVWKKGMGILTGPQFLKVEIKNNIVHLEAWIKFAILPGIFVGELDTKGFIGFIPKKLLRKRIEMFEKIIFQ